MYLALLSLVLGVVATLEARTIRAARQELEALRTERERVKAGIDQTWAQQSVEELAVAIRWLDMFYAEPSEGFGRPVGSARMATRRSADHDVCVGRFLPLRAAGQSLPGSINQMKTDIMATEGYRQAKVFAEPSRKAAEASSCARVERFLPVQDDGQRRPQVGVVSKPRRLDEESLAGPPGGSSFDERRVTGHRSATRRRFARWSMRRGQRHSVEDYTGRLSAHRVIPLK